MDYRATATALWIAFLIWSASGALADKPCAARKIKDNSVVCVCNATYCDEITREEPSSDSYVAYTSSEGGLRFKKTVGGLEKCKSDKLFDLFSAVLLINPQRKYQKIEGFGGSFTDSASINWSKLPKAQKQFLIDSYCGAKGIEYNVGRVPIGGCDFSTRPYTYNEKPKNDTKLTNYTLSIEDYKYKLPMIKACMQVSTSPLQLVASTWSPPIWMKTNHNITGRSRLLPQYYQTYALYHTKFVEKYQQEGVPIWAITTTNEPMNGKSTRVPFNDLGWDVKEMGHWIEKNLGPTMRQKCGGVKILGCDDQRYTIPNWFDKLVKEVPGALQYIDGVGTHWYADKVTPASLMSHVVEDYPDKFVMGTEACAGFRDNKVKLGSWSRAKDYALDILEDLNNMVSGWIDWNLCLDEKGGPNWSNNFVDSPVIISADKGEFIKQPMFYAMGHFSKFVPRNSRRVRVSECGIPSGVKHVAVLTPKNTIVVVLYNDSLFKETVTLKLDGKEAVIELEPNSITTVELPYGSNRADQVYVDPLAY